MKAAAAGLQNEVGDGDPAIPVSPRGGCPSSSGLAPGDSIRQHSRSFSFASRLLPAPERAAVERLYAWCRWCDDGVDCAEGPQAAVTFLDRAAEDLQLIRAGRPPVATESRWLAELIEQYELPVAAAEALLLGMRSDLTPASDFSEDDLLRYAFRVAGSVGVLMCPILGLRDYQFLPHAAALGMGMQLTNIARDIAEDWRRGRCYLPVAWTAGLRPSGTRPDSRLVTAGVRQLLDVADGYYAAGEFGIAALDRRARLAVRTAARVYHAIGTVIRRRGCLVWEKRARVSAVLKLKLFADSLISPVISQRPAAAPLAAERPLAAAADLLREHGVLA